MKRANRTEEEIKEEALKVRIRKANRTEEEK